MSDPQQTSWQVNAGFWTWHLLVPLLCAACALVLLERFPVDLWLANQWWALEGHRWALRNHWFTAELIHHRGKQLVIVLGLVLLMLVILSRWLHRLHRWRLEIKPADLTEALWSRLKLISGAALAVLLVGLTSSSFLASFAREHKELRYYTNPLTPLYALYGFTRARVTAPGAAVKEVGGTAKTDRPARLWRYPDRSAPDGEPRPVLLQALSTRVSRLHSDLRQPPARRLPRRADSRCPGAITVDSGLIFAHPCSSSAGVPKTAQSRDETGSRCAKFNGNSDTAPATVSEGKDHCSHCALHGKAILLRRCRHRPS